MGCASKTDVQESHLLTGNKYAFQIITQEGGARVDIYGTVPCLVFF